MRNGHRRGSEPAGKVRPRLWPRLQDVEGRGRWTQNKLGIEGQGHRMLAHRAEATWGTWDLHTTHSSTQDQWIWEQGHGTQGGAGFVWRKVGLEKELLGMAESMLC
jgi:hypothetical protein